MEDVRVYTDGEWVGTVKFADGTTKEVHRDYNFTRGISEEKDLPIVMEIRQVREDKPFRLVVANGNEPLHKTVLRGIEPID